MKEIYVRRMEKINIIQCLLENDYIVKEEDGIYLVELKDKNNSKVVMIVEDETLFVQLDLVSTKVLKEDISLYKKLLDLNTEILPVSLAIDSTNPEDARIVINESLAIKSLDDNELLKVFETMELNLEKIFNILLQYKK